MQRQGVFTLVYIHAVRLTSSVMRPPLEVANARRRSRLRAMHACRIESTLSSCVCDSGSCFQETESGGSGGFSAASAEGWRLVMPVSPLLLPAPAGWSDDMSATEADVNSVSTAHHSNTAVSDCATTCHTSKPSLAGWGDRTLPPFELSAAARSPRWLACSRPIRLDLGDSVQDRNADRVRFGRSMMALGRGEHSGAM